MPAGTLTYLHANLTPGTVYTYRLRAGNDDGLSAWSAEATVTTAPNIPSLTAQANSTTQISLRWTSVSGAVRYELEHDVNGSWQRIYAGANTGYLDSGLTAGAAYGYHVRAVNANSAASDWGNEITASTKPAVPILGALQVKDSTQIIATWSSVANAAEYDLEYQANAGAWARITLTDGETTYTLTGLLSMTGYTVRIRAVTSTGMASDWSPLKIAVTGLGAPVLNLTVSMATQVTLTWPAVTGATSYILQRQVNGGMWGTLPILAGARSYTDSGLSLDTLYAYRLCYKKGNNTSAWSVAATYTTPTTTGIHPMTGEAVAHPATRTAVPVLTGSAVSMTEIRLSWTAVPGAQAFRIFRDGSVLTPAPLPDLARSFTDVVDSTSTHAYTVDALRANGEVVPSNEVIITAE